jgi:hypothetical protein
MKSARRLPPPWSVEELDAANLLLIALPARKISDDFIGRGIVVKAFLAACLAAIVLAVVAAIVLNSLQEPADRAFTTPYTRVGD